MKFSKDLQLRSEAMKILAPNLQGAVAQLNSSHFRKPGYRIYIYAPHAGRRLQGGWGPDNKSGQQSYCGGHKTVWLSRAVVVVTRC